MHLFLARAKAGLIGLEFVKRMEKKEEHPKVVERREYKSLGQGVLVKEKAIKQLLPARNRD